MKDGDYFVVFNGIVVMSGTLTECLTNVIELPDEKREGIGIGYVKGDKLLVAPLYVYQADINEIQGIDDPRYKVDWEINDDEYE